MQSIFDKIIARQIPAEIIYEDQSHIVILSIQPHNPGHMLVIPKTHSTGDFWEMDATELSEMVSLAQRMARLVKKVFDPKRVGMVFEGFGVADHVHLHVIPINTPFDLDQNQASDVSPDELRQVADKLRGQLKSEGSN